jgi:hypothetical protein
MAMRPSLRAFLTGIGVVSLALAASAAPATKGRKRRAHPATPAPRAAATASAASASATSTIDVTAVPASRGVPTDVTRPALAHDASTHEAAPSATAPTPKLEVGAGIILYGYLPLLAGLDNNLELYYANLLLDGTFGRFGMHVEPRLRDTKLRPYFASSAWIEEAYAYVDFGPIFVKLGKEYSRLGLFWDNSFYGNLQSFDGLKVDPDEGLSVEGRVGTNAGLTFWAQFFLMDGRTNISLDGRDTISIPGAARRNQAVLRLEPFVRLGPHATAKVGLSGEYFRADIPDDAHNVVRGALDATLSIGDWQTWGEFIVQQGQSVTDFPYEAIPATAMAPEVPGRASSHNEYWLVGTEYTYRFLVARYNFSLARYSSVAVTEWIQEPGIGVVVNSQISALAEYVLWRRFAAEGHSTVDSSVNLTLNAHF